MFNGENNAVSFASPLDKFIRTSLLSFQHNTEFIDLILVCGNVHYKVHHLLLACYSPYFDSLDPSALEAGDEGVRVHTLSSSIAPHLVARILTYMYTGYLDANHHPEELVGALLFFKMDDAAKMVGALSKNVAKCFRSDVVKALYPQVAGTLKRRRG